MPNRKQKTKTELKGPKKEMGQPSSSRPQGKDQDFLTPDLKNLALEPANGENSSESEEPESSVLTEAAKKEIEERVLAISHLPRETTLGLLAYYNYDFQLFVAEVSGLERPGVIPDTLKGMIRDGIISGQDEDPYELANTFTSIVGSKQVIIDFFYEEKKRIESEWKTKKKTEKKLRQVKTAMSNRKQETKTDSESSKGEAGPSSSSRPQETDQDPSLPDLKNLALEPTNGKNSSKEEPDWSVLDEASEKEIEEWALDISKLPRDYTLDLLAHWKYDIRLFKLSLEIPPLMKNYIKEKIRVNVELGREGIMPFDLVEPFADTSLFDICELVDFYFDEQRRIESEKRGVDNRTN